MPGNNYQVDAVKQDDCDQAQSLHEIERLRAELQATNMKLVAVASLNKNLMNERDKAKHLHEERDTLQQQLAGISDVLEHDRKMTTAAINELAEDKTLMRKEIDELKTKLAHAVTSQHHTEEIAKAEEKYTAVKERLEKRLVDKDQDHLQKLRERELNWEQERNALQSEIDQLTRKIASLEDEQTKKMQEEKKEHAKLRLAIEDKLTSNQSALLAQKQNLDQKHREELEKCQKEHQLALDEIRQEHKLALEKRDIRDKKTREDTRKQVADVQAELRQSQAQHQALLDKAADQEHNHRREYSLLQTQFDEAVREKQASQKRFAELRAKFEEQQTQHKKDLQHKEAVARGLLEPQVSHYKQQALDAQRALEQLRMETAAKLVLMKQQIQFEADALSAEKAQHQETKAKAVADCQQARKEKMSMQLALDKYKNVEHQMQNEQKLNRSLTHENESLQAELKDAVEFIEQQEARYEKSREECITLLKKVRELQDYQHLENNVERQKSLEADEKLMRAEVLFREAQDMQQRTEYERQMMNMSYQTAAPMPFYMQQQQAQRRGPNASVIEPEHPDIQRMVESFLKSKQNTTGAQLTLRQKYTDGCTFMFGSEEVFIEEVGSALYVRCYTSEMGDEYVLKPLNTWLNENQTVAPKTKQGKGIAI